MLIQLAIGSIAILVTMGVMLGFMNVSMRLYQKIQERVAYPIFARHQFFVLVAGAVLLVLAANTICVWIWAALFRNLGVFTTLEEALYFSMVSFTTVGYGDVVVSQDWRILAGFVGVNGLLAFGIFTAFMVEVMRELSKRYLDRP